MLPASTFRQDSTLATYCLLFIGFASLARPIVSAAGVSCGRSDQAVATIWRGESAREHQWPWVVSIRNKTTGVHVCTGALISNTLIVTAAHCLRRSDQSDYTASDLFVALGAHRLISKGRLEEWIPVETIYTHPRYRSPGVRTWSYDLAVVRIARSGRFEKAASPVCLPPNNREPKKDEQCIIVGWGKTEFSVFSNEMRQAQVPMMSRRTCNERRYWNGYLDRTMICALDRVSGRSACQGDSGGPVICQRGSRSQWTVYGVVSWGPIACGGKPSIYSNIARELRWLRGVFRKSAETLLTPLTTPKMMRVTPPSYRARTQKPTTTTTTTSSSVDLPTPPCDATLFERIPQYYVDGPKPDAYIVYGADSEADCIKACCDRGRQDCASVIWLAKWRQCRFRSVRRCDIVNKRDRGFVNQHVVYYGLHCARH